MDMIFITGYKRPECLTGTILKRHGIPFNVLLHDNEQAKEYVNWKNEVIVTNAKPGKFNQMRWIANNCEGKAFIIEDDIPAIEYIDPSGNFDDGYPLLKNVYEEDCLLMNRSGIGIVGFSKTSNRFWRKPYRNPVVQFTNMVGTAYIIDVEFLKFMCEDFPDGYALEDLIISMKTIQRYGNTIIDHRLHFKNNRGNGTNDSSSGYGHGKERIAREVAEMDTLISSNKYPFFHYTMRKDGKGFRIHFRKGK